MTWWNFEPVLKPTKRIVENMTRVTVPRSWIPKWYKWDETSLWMLFTRACWRPWASSEGARNTCGPGWFWAYRTRRRGRGWCTCPRNQRGPAWRGTASAGSLSRSRCRCTRRRDTSVRAPWRRRAKRCGTVGRLARGACRWTRCVTPEGNSSPSTRWAGELCRHSGPTWRRRRRREWCWGGCSASERRSPGSGASRRASISCRGPWRRSWWRRCWRLRVSVAGWGVFGRRSGSLGGRSPAFPRAQQGAPRCSAPASAASFPPSFSCGCEAVRRPRWVCERLRRSGHGASSFPNLTRTGVEQGAFRQGYPWRRQQLSDWRLKYKREMCFSRPLNPAWKNFHWGAVVGMVFYTSAA